MVGKLIDFSSINHVFFDLDHTLWDFEKNSQEVLGDMYHLFTPIHQCYESLQSWLDAYRAENYRLWGLYSKQMVSRDELRLGRFANTIKGSVSSVLIQDMADYYLHHTPQKRHVMAHTFEVLDHFKAQGKGIHILTNGFKPTQIIKLEKSGIGAYVQNLITSDDSGALKPNKNMFEYALGLAKARPDQVVMIGDCWDSDVIGAHQANWNSIWYNPEKKENNHPLKIKDIQCLSELYLSY